MREKFDYFVIFAEMRTGSNYLESNLNVFDGLISYGEAFNPSFIGFPNRTEVLGLTQADRDADPMRLLDAIRQSDEGLGGFRYFHDHDPRVLQTCLNDPRCAKIILTRNPADSYVSWKIARSTGQWKLNDLKRRKEGQAVFDAEEFRAHLDRLQAFQIHLLHQLQVTGQTAFYLAYEDLADVQVINGLARFLGLDEQLGGLDKKLKKQNPEPISEKVENFAEMQAALASLDRFNLTRTPNFEPRRGPVVRQYVAAARAPLMYLPIRGGPDAEISGWLAALDDVPADALKTGLSPKEVENWKRTHVGHRSFTVVRHPLARAHAAFCARVLSVGPGHLEKFRQVVKRRYKVPLPQRPSNPGYTVEAHKEAFTSFLAFLKGNLAGQTVLRVDSSWCSQAQMVQGFGEFALPDQIVREDEMDRLLPQLAERLGYPDAPLPPEPVPDEPYTLAEIYDETLEALAQDAYQRDYAVFGFDTWPGV